MKKRILFLFLLFIIIIASFVFYLTTKKNGPLVSPPAIAPPPPKINVSDEKIVIKTAQGDVSINNIEQNPVKKISFDDSVVFKESSDYEMSYYPPDQGFIITLMNRDLSTARANAEQDFLDALGISQEQSCFLKVTLNVPFDISQQASGKNYGLSFCPNGKPFPAN